MDFIEFLYSCYLSCVQSFGSINYEYTPTSTPRYIYVQKGAIALHIRKQKNGRARRRESDIIFTSSTIQLILLGFHRHFLLSENL